MPLDLPFRFPSEAQKICEEAREFRRLSPDERFRRILDLIGSGELLMAAARSPSGSANGTKPNGNAG